MAMAMAMARACTTNCALKLLRPSLCRCFFPSSLTRLSLSPPPAPHPYPPPIASWNSLSPQSVSASHRRGVVTVSEKFQVRAEGGDGHGHGHGHGNGHGNGDGNGDGNGGGDGSFNNGDDTPPKSIFSWYLVLLNNHPIATKAVTSALLTLFGDIVAQLLVEKRETIDIKRLSIFTLLGFVLVAPTLHFWYLSLSKIVPGPGIPKAGLRLLLDQFIFSPVFIGVFFSSLMVLEGHVTEIVPKLRQDWLSAVITNWKIWIPFQFFNFLLVPQQLQVLAANVIALAWNTYLSVATHKHVLPVQNDETSEK